MSQPKMLPPDIDIKQTTEVVCDKCNNSTFTQALLIRKISALLTKSGKEAFIPIQVFSCTKCGNVNQIFVPEELKNPIIS